MREGLEATKSLRGPLSFVVRSLYARFRLSPEEGSSQKQPEDVTKLLEARVRRILSERKDDPSNQEIREICFPLVGFSDPIDGQTD